MILIVPIVKYHQGAQPVAASNPLAVPPTAYAAQLARLNAEGFRTLTASAVATAPAAGTDLPDRAVVFTLDDGFARIGASV